MEYAIYFCLLYSMLLKFYMESSKQMNFVVGRLFSRPVAYSHCQGSTPMLGKCLLNALVKDFVWIFFKDTQVLKGIRGNAVILIKMIWCTCSIFYPSVTHLALLFLFSAF